jgi:hypothetical protein
MGNTHGGYQLPNNATVTGAYKWTAVYSGDGNNNGKTDDGSSAKEQLSVTAASPKIVTTSNPTGTVNVGTTALTATDTIVVSGGYFIAGGKLQVTLSGPAGFTSVVNTVNLTGTTGNGTYTVTVTVPVTAPVGTYTWTVTYAGNGNNNSANDQGGANEQFTLRNVVSRNEAATLGYWDNNNGQKLLKTYTNYLGTWLASTYPKLFGNLNGATGATIATYYDKIVKPGTGTNDGTLYAQVFTTALNVFVTTTGLGWNGAHTVSGTTSSSWSSAFGFKQGFGIAGLGDIFINVGNNGASFGVANNTPITVSTALTYFNRQATLSGGSTSTKPTIVFYALSPDAQQSSLKNGANNVFDSINETGDII